MNKYIFLTLGMTLLCVSAAMAQSNTVTVTPKSCQAKTVRPQVVADNIIRAPDVTCRGKGEEGLLPLSE